MAKGNDKKIVKDTCELLLATIGNLLESHRERRFHYKSKAVPYSRDEFCRRTGLEPGTVAHIETGRLLWVGFPQIRRYLATIYARDDAQFADSVKKVYDGLRQLKDVLKRL